MGEMGPIEYFICGGFGGICTVVVGHPLDTIKVSLPDRKPTRLGLINDSCSAVLVLHTGVFQVRLQTMPLPAAGEKPIYSGTFDCLKKTVVNEGILGLYKGMGAPLVGVAPIFAISFLGYGMGKQIFGTKDPKDFGIINYFAAGAFSGIFTTSIMAPGERIKCLLQIQEGANKPKIYNGPIDVVRQLYKQGGITSIYRGSAATLLRDVPASGLYFLTYEVLKNYITENGTKEAPILGTICAGGAAGIANWLIGMPADVLKSRLQTAPEGTYPNGVRDVFKDLMVKEGPLALYKGIIPVLLRAFPANAACFVGFEMCRKFLNYLFPRTNTALNENKL